MIENILLEEANKEYESNRNLLLEYGIKNDLVADIENYPHAFLLSCIMDRRILSERAWSIPPKIIEIIGSFNILDLYKISEEEYVSLFREHNLHKYNELMPKVFYKAVHKIVDEYNGNASNIWKDNPSSATLILRLLEFDGVGVKIATMTANILSRAFNVKLKDFYSIDISPDTHVKRVFRRMGLVEDTKKIEKIIYKAREINPNFPGKLDLTCWNLGKTICTKKQPKCDICIFNSECPKNIDEKGK